MTHIRQAILAELKRRGWTQYRLIQEANVNKDPIYKFLAGTRDTTTRTIEPVLATLGLRIVGPKK